MDKQYQFHLKCKSISLRQASPKGFLFRASLLQADSETQRTSPVLQTEQLRLPPSRKVYELSGLPTFKFRSTKQNSHKGFYVKCQLQESNQPPSSILISTFQIINLFQNSQKNLFVDKYEGKNVEIQYQIAVSVFENVIPVTVKQPLQQKWPQEQMEADQAEEKAASDREKVTNSISRGRPPLLNISKVIVGTKSKSESNFINLSPVPSSVKEEIKDLASPFLGRIDTYEDKSSGLALNKNITSLPLSQIEKVNELLKSHQRPTEHTTQSWTISYKLKIVFTMLIIGIASLAFDTINDRFAAKRQNEKGKKAHEKKKKSSKASKVKSH